MSITEPERKQGERRNMRDKMSSAVRKCVRDYKSIESEKN